MTAAGVWGPGWSSSGLDIAAGRYPLAVERHVLRMADRLVPGVTTLTPHARYYALHGLVAAEAARTGLDPAGAQELLRRCEVALAAVSYAHHPEPLAWLPQAHGQAALARRLHTGELDAVEAARPGESAYGKNVWGFWAPYKRAEILLGILTPGRYPMPGPDLKEEAVRSGLDGLLELARESVLRVDELAPLGERLCVCAGATRPDGAWLADLMCRPDGEEGSSAQIRHQTVRLLARVIDRYHVAWVTRDVGERLAFGDFLERDPVCCEIAVAPTWRGAVLRNHAVSAWRRLWSWLVDQVDELMPISELAECFAAELPDTTVGAFHQGLYATSTDAGIPLPAELELRRAAELTTPERELAILAVSSNRVDELTGATLTGFLGPRGVELGPQWMQQRLSERPAEPLRDFARRLVHVLVARAQRIALSKSARRKDGSLWLPTRLHQIGDQLYRTGNGEGATDVGLRLDQLALVLATCGVLDAQAEHWTVTPAWRKRLA